MFVALAIVAAAHPMGESAAGQTSVLVIFPDHVEVDYLVDVPNAFVQTARPGSGTDVGAMATELASGLLLTIDGRTVAMRVRSPSPLPRPSSEHTTGFVVRLSAPLPEDARAIELQTANLQEASNFFAGDVRVHPSLGVASSSLLGVRDGAVVRDDTLRWTRGEEHRRLGVVLADRAPRWWGWVAPQGDTPVRVARALEKGPRDLLRPPALTPALWLAGLVAAAASGSTTGRDPRAVGLAGLGIGLAVLPGDGTGRVELFAVLAAIGLGVAARWRGAAGPLVLPIVVAGLAGTTHSAPAALGVVLAWGVGCLLGAPRPRAALALAVGLGAVVLARALARLT